MKRWMIVLAGVGVVAGGIAVTAQVTDMRPNVPAMVGTAYAWGGGSAWHGGGRHHGRHGGPMMDEAHIEAGLAFLRTRLAITDAQQPSWDALADVVRSEVERLRPEIEAMREMHRGEGEPAPAPERLAAMENTMQEAIAAFGAVRTAFEPLYEVLDDEQRAMVDELLQRGPHGPRGDGERPGRRGGRDRG